MIMPPVWRKTVLFAHVTTSVGWLGAVLAYLALDITTVASQDIATVRGAYTSMDLILRYAIVPLALVSVLIGIVNALGTTWGLLRHYWVVVKFVLTLAATVVLLQETSSVSYLTSLAGTTADPRTLSSTLPHSIGGLTVLLTTAILSVFKPRGLTRYGWRKQQQRQRSDRLERGPEPVVRSASGASD